MAREIIDLIQNSHTPGNIQQVEQIEDIIRNNMTYFGFDFVDILLNAGDSDGDSDIVIATEGERENKREDFVHGMDVET
jgi:hypothetical protein